MKNVWRKLKRISKRFIPVVSCFVFCISSFSFPAFADPVTVISGGSLWGVATAGAMAEYGISTDVSGSDVGIDFVNSSIGGGRYSEFVHSDMCPSELVGTDVDTWASTYGSGVSVSYTYDRGVKVAVINYDQTVSRHMQAYLTWLLQDQLNIDGIAEPEIGPGVVSYSSSDFPAEPLYSIDGGSTVNDRPVGTFPLTFHYQGTSSGNTYDAVYTSSSPSVYYYWMSYESSSGTSVRLVPFSFIPGQYTIREITFQNGTVNERTIELNTLNYLYYYNNSLSYPSARITNFPLDYTYTGFGTYTPYDVLGPVSDDSLQNSGEASITLSAIGDDVAVPNPSSEDYEPTLIPPVPLNIPYDGSGAIEPSGLDIPTSVSDPVLQGVVDNTLEKVESETFDDVIEDEAVSTNVLPYAFTFDLPGGGGGGFSFSSIWQYVVDWIHCISPFVLTIRNVWNMLPYCMVVPVWASAVIIIVFGVYRRFIH